MLFKSDFRTSIAKILIFGITANQVIAPCPTTIGRGGKSGQYRATHRLIAGPGFYREDSATENNRPDESRGKGENVR